MFCTEELFEDSMVTSFLQEVSPNETCVLVFEADGRRLGGLTAKKVNFGKEYRK